jgi:hypothetical protein
MSRRAASMAAMAKRATNPQDIQAIQKNLVDGVQNGSIQPYVGIPLIQELTQRLAEVKTQMAQTMAGAGMPQAPQGQQAPPIAEQVMQQAAQEGQGIEALPSNLPQEYAGGGIIAFEGGGEVQRFNEGLLVDANYPDSYYRSQAEPEERKRAPLTIQEQVKQYQDLMTAIPKGASQTEYEEYLKNRSGAAEATKKQDLNLALAQFGLNLAAGKSPRALENLGEAGIKALPAVQEAYKQRRLADETALRGRAELDRMSRAEQLEALKGGVGLYGKERELQAEAEKAELQRQNALKVAELQMAHKPTDLGNFVNDYVSNRIKAGDKRSPEAIKVEAYDKFPGYVVRQEAIQASKAIAGGAQALTGSGQTLNAQSTALKEFNDLDPLDPAKKAYRDAARQDKKNKANGIDTNLADQVRQDWIRANTPGAQPAPAAPKTPPPASTSTAPKGAAPSIADVKGAPAGSKIGAYTTNGWEIRGKDGALLGYAGSK